MKRLAWVQSSWVFVSHGKGTQVWVLTHPPPDSDSSLYSSPAFSVQKSNETRSDNTCKGEIYCNDCQIYLEMEGRVFSVLNHAVMQLVRIRSKAPQQKVYMMGDGTPALVSCRHLSRLWANSTCRTLARSFHQLHFTCRDAERFQVHFNLKIMRH